MVLHGVSRSWVQARSFTCAHSERTHGLHQAPARTSCTEGDCGEAMSHMAGVGDYLDICSLGNEHLAGRCLDFAFGDGTAFWSFICTCRLPCQESLAAPFSSSDNAATNSCLPSGTGCGTSTGQVLLCIQFVVAIPSFAFVGFGEHVPFEPRDAEFLSRLQIQSFIYVCTTSLLGVIT